MTYRKPRPGAGLSSFYHGDMSDSVTETAAAHLEFFKPAPDEENEVVGIGFAGVGSVQTAPDAPAVVRAPSNRTTGALVALLGGVIFAALYALAAWGYSAAAWLYGDAAAGVEATGFIQQRTLAFLSTPVYWLTVLAFTVYFVVLAVLINKGHWRTFVLWGLAVAALTYLSAIGAGLLTVDAWTLTFSQALDFMWRGIAFNPLVLVAVVLSREIPIWLGGWIALKGRALRNAPTAEPAEITV